MEGADDSTEPLRQPKITRLLDRNISNYQRRIGQSLSQRGKSNGLLHNLRRVPHQQTVQVLLHEEAALPPAKQNWCHRGFEPTTYSTSGKRHTNMPPKPVC